MYTKVPRCQKDDDKGSIDTMTPNGPLFSSALDTNPLTCPLTAFKESDNWKRYAPHSPMSDDACERLTSTRLSISPTELLVRVSWRGWSADTLTSVFGARLFPSMSSWACSGLIWKETKYTHLYSVHMYAHV